MAVISSRQHPMVKACRAIARGDDPRVLLDGWHLVVDALSTGLPLEWIAVHDTRRSGDEAAQLARRAEAGGARVLHVSSAVIDAMSPVRTPSGVVAIAARPSIEPRALLAPDPALVVAGLGLQDPGNVGALVRSADAGGATGVLVDAASADPWSWKALRASMGSTFRLPVRRDEDALSRLERWRADGIRVVAADPHGGAAMYDHDLTRPLVFVLGGEGAGLPSAVLERADARVRVPMRARVESLNVAVAAALLVYEAARQRGRQSP
jgi:TrmH family RNA methyltransferase